MGFFDLKGVSWEHDVQKNTTTSTIKTKLGKEFNLKLRNSLPGNKWSLDAGFKGLEIKYNIATRDVELEKKFITRPGELKLKQKVPAGRIFLVPSPELWLKMTPVKNSNVTMEMEPSYSLLDRKCNLEASLELQKRHKLKLEACSKAGPKNATFTLSTKPQGSLAKAAKSVALKYSVTGGPSLIHEVEPTSKLSLKSTVGVKGKDLKVMAEIKPGKVAGVKPKLTLESKVSQKAPTKPTLTAGISLDL